MLSWSHLPVQLHTYLLSEIQNQSGKIPSTFRHKESAKQWLSFVVARWAGRKLKCKQLMTVRKRKCNLSISKKQIMTAEEKFCIVSSGLFSVSLMDLVMAQATPCTLKELLGHCLIRSARDSWSIFQNNLVLQSPCQLHLQNSSGYRNCPQVQLDPAWLICATEMT